LQSVYEQLKQEDPLHAARQTAQVEISGLIDVNGVDVLFSAYDSLGLFAPGKPARKIR
jgi:hypothetical protein